jgi:hypothetical protein
VRAILHESSFWAPKGHTVVCSQLDVSAEVLRALTQPDNGPLGKNIHTSSSAASRLQLQSSSAAHVITYTSGDEVAWEATIDIATGMLSRCDSSWTIFVQVPEYKHSFVSPM